MVDDNKDASKKDRGKGKPAMADGAWRQDGVPKPCRGNGWDV